VSKSSKSRWRKVRRWREWRERMGSTPIRSLAGASLYLAGRLGGSGAVKLLPVHVNESSPSLATPARSEDSCSTFSAGTIHIELRHAQVHIAGSANPVLLRVLLECLLG
jgi:hypothetical protein